MIGGLIDDGLRSKATGRGPFFKVQIPVVQQQAIAARGPVPQPPPRGPSPGDLGRKYLPRGDRYFEQFGKQLPGAQKPPPDDAQDEQREPAPNGIQGGATMPTQPPSDPLHYLTDYLNRVLSGSMDDAPPGPVTTSTEEAIAKKIIGDVAVRPLKVVNWLLGGSNIDSQSKMEPPLPDPNAPRPLTPQQRVDPAVAAFFERIGGAVLVGAAQGPRRPAVIEKGGSLNRHEQAMTVLEDAGTLGQIVNTVAFPGWASDP